MTCLLKEEQGSRWWLIGEDRNRKERYLIETFSFGLGWGKQTDFRSYFERENRGKARRCFGVKVSEGYFKEQGRSRSGLIISQHKFSTVVLFYFIFQSYHASFLTFGMFVSVI